MSKRRRRLIGSAAAATALLTMTACGQIYPSKEPAQSPAGGVQSDVRNVVVGFAQQQLQAPYFAVIANLLSLLNVSTFLQDAFRGALILVAVTLATVQFTRRKKTSPTQPAAK